MHSISQFSEDLGKSLSHPTCVSIEPAASLMSLVPSPAEFLPEAASRGQKQTFYSSVLS